MGIMSGKDRQAHHDLCWLLLRKWALPEPKPSAQTILALAMRDSKRGLCGEAPTELSDVLLRKMGDIVETPTNNLSKIPCKLIEEWLVSMGLPDHTALARGGA
mmetsp:Transcript_11897/g.42566  ORF Transcript_11897/g.42566 Transcript_11897/m.42566 type:complete len:103 (-) Transcript_11897:145-453(-)